MFYINRPIQKTVKMYAHLEACSWFGSTFVKVGSSYRMSLLYCLDLCLGVLQCIISNSSNSENFDLYQVKLFQRWFREFQSLISNTCQTGLLRLSTLIRPKISVALYFVDIFHWKDTSHLNFNNCYVNRTLMSSFGPVCVLVHFTYFQRSINLFNL